MELALLDEAHWGLAGPYLPPPQVSVHLGGLLLSCYSILLLGICRRRKRLVTEACVRKEIHFCVISMVQGERGALPDSNSEQRTYLDVKLPSQRPNASALCQREVQPTKATLKLRV